MRISEAATRLSVTAETIDDWIADGVLILGDGGVTDASVEIVYEDVYGAWERLAAEGDDER